MILVKETTKLFEKTEVFLTSVFSIAALTGSPNQRPSEFVEGRVLLMNKFPRKINKSGTHKFTKNIKHRK